MVHPAGNSDFTDVCNDDAELLTEHSTFTATTLEDRVGAGALPPTTSKTLRARYIEG